MVMVVVVAVAVVVVAAAVMAAVGAAAMVVDEKLYEHVKLTCHCMIFVQRTCKKQRFLTGLARFRYLLCSGVCYETISYRYVDNIVVGLYIHAG
jgi:hypothetical protein